MTKFMRLFLIIGLFFHWMINSSVWAQQKLTDEEKQMLEQTQPQVQANQVQANQVHLVGFGVGAPFGHGLMFGSSIKIEEQFDLRLQGGIGLRYLEASALLYYAVNRKHSIGIGYHFNPISFLGSLVQEALLEAIFASDVSVPSFLLASSISLLYKYQLTDDGKHELTIGLSQNLYFFDIKLVSISDAVKQEDPFLFLYVLGYNYKF